MSFERTRFGGVLVVFALGAATPSVAVGSADFARFRQGVEELVAPKAWKGVFAGSGPWLFLRSELHGAAGLGPWPPPGGAEPTAPLDPERSDALAAVDDFAAQLRARGVPLLFVLVPPKIQVYPDRLFPGLRADRLGLERPQRRFLDQLERRRIAVVDLAPRFRTEADRGSEPLFAAQDSHWTSYAARLAAAAIAEALEALGIEPGGDLGLVEQRSTRDDCGDLWIKLKEPRPPCAPLTLYSVRPAVGDELAPTVSRTSPILLLGDSSALVYHQSERAGLVDHLAREIGRPIDLLGVTAGGANAAREALVRRGDGLDGKRVVVWLVSGRMLYEDPAWRPIPIPPSTPPTPRPPAPR
jgi:hypothetical protein